MLTVVRSPTSAVLYLHKLGVSRVAGAAPPDIPSGLQPLPMYSMASYLGIPQLMVRGW